MKQVVLKIPNSSYVNVKSIDPGNIYVFKSGCDVYKAHSSHDNKWTFVCLGDSECCANGYHSSLERLLKSNLHRDVEIYEFHTYVDFIKWAKDNF